MTKSPLLIAITVAGLAAGCISTQTPGTVKLESASADKSDGPLVSRLALSETMGEVGRPFVGEFVHNDNYISDAEYSLSTVPPGLKFDAKKGVLRGVPAKPGFYHITLGVRERVAKDKLWPSQNGSDRWWTEDIELAIYSPIH